MTKNANLGPKIPIWGQKGQYLAKNAYSRPNLAFKAKILVFWGWSQSFWYQNFWYPRSHIREPMRQVLKTLTGNRPLRKSAMLTPKFGFLGPKVIFLPVTNLLIHWLLLSRLDWCDPDMWRCQPKTCWGCWCCWRGSCWQQLVADLGADVKSQS